MVWCNDGHMNGFVCYVLCWTLLYASMIVVMYFSRCWLRVDAFPHNRWKPIADMVETNLCTNELVHEAHGKRSVSRPKFCHALQTSCERLCNVSKSMIEPRSTLMSSWLVVRYPPSMC